MEISLSSNLLEGLILVALQMVRSNHYYGGYDGTVNEWDDYPRFLNPDGVEMPPGVYGDNGSLMYHHGFGYAPYSPYSPTGTPVPTVGHDGQLYGAQHYQYPTTYFQPMTPTSGPYNPSLAAPTKGDLSISAAADQTPLPVDTANGNSNGITNERGALPGGIPTSGYQDPRFGFDSLRSPIVWMDGSIYSEGQPRPLTSTALTSVIATATTGGGVKALDLRTGTRDFPVNGDQLRVHCSSFPWPLCNTWSLCVMPIQSSPIGTIPYQIDNIYNFGELLALAHPIVKSLLGTKVEWLYYIFEAFNSGDLVCYQELCRVHRDALNAQPALVENEKKLLGKINILCLMEIIFSRPSEDRTIPLNIIAKRRKLTIDDVEYLLTKSLSKNLFSILRKPEEMLRSLLRAAASATKNPIELLRHSNPNYN
ncbi:hypothetical protein F0562_013390 [Nyssa sinensis]|uniref:PCI domain-containing protein n=1 Tax=Nyssa sinensis TaxID=561372 RepID=A0A5J4ZPT3_9ASTE|nr:hypothetical protein F0562_013390 [Nyssa sinensis]